MNSPPASAITVDDSLWLSVRPPTRSRASSTHTSLPLVTSSRAALRPARPAPTITTSTVRVLRLRLAAAVPGSHSAVPAALAAPMNFLRVSPSDKGGHSSGRVLKLQEHAGRAEVCQPRGTQLVLLAGALADVAEDGYPRLLLLDRAQDRLAAEALVEVALGRRVHHQHAALGAVAQLVGR